MSLWGQVVSYDGSSKVKKQAHSKCVDLDNPVTDVVDKDEEESTNIYCAFLAFLHTVSFHMRPQVAFPERIHIHIGCIGDQEEEEEWTRMGKKGGEWKGYLARVGGGSSSWLVALRLGHWCGTAGVQEGHTAPGEKEYAFSRQHHFHAS